MNRCPANDDLLRLWAAAADEMPEQRAHLAECASCTRAYDDLVRDARLIGEALGAVADQMRTPSPARRRYGFPAGLRTIVTFGGAMAFGGAAAFALMVTLGWHPVNRQTKPVLASVASAGGAGQWTGAAARHNGAIRATDVIVNDPLVGFTYGDVAQSDNLSAADDLLFCTPEDDGSSICSTGAEQG